MTQVLMILTGTDQWTMKDNTRHPTGFWGEEFKAPYRAFTKAGLDVTIATPEGKTPTVDPLSLALQYNDNQEAVDDTKTFLEEMADKLASTTPLSEIDPADYGVVFVVGGHGPMQDLAVDPQMQRILLPVLDDSNKIVAAVCHGPASFLTVFRDDGSWAFKGRRLTGFSNLEESMATFAGNAPWLLEDRLIAGGAQYVAAPEPYTPHAEVDGNLVTGQQQVSAQKAAEAVLEILQVAA